MELKEILKITWILYGFGIIAYYYHTALLRIMIRPDGSFLNGLLIEIGHEIVFLVIPISVLLLLLENIYKKKEITKIIILFLLGGTLSYMGKIIYVYHQLRINKLDYLNEINSEDILNLFYVNIKIKYNRVELKEAFYYFLETEHGLDRSNIQTIEVDKLIFGITEMKGVREVAEEYANNIKNPGLITLFLDLLVKCSAKSVGILGETIATSLSICGQIFGTVGIPVIAVLGSLGLIVIVLTGTWNILKMKFSFLEGILGGTTTQINQVGARVVQNQQEVLEISREISEGLNILTQTVDSHSQTFKELLPLFERLKDLGSAATVESVDKLRVRIVEVSNALDVFIGSQNNIIEKHQTDILIEKEKVRDSIGKLMQNDIELKSNLESVGEVVRSHEPILFALERIFRKIAEIKQIEFPVDGSIPEEVQLALLEAIIKIMS